MDREMIDGERVEIRENGTEEWYEGTVIKARKMWVEDDTGYIWDENTIAEWRPLPSTPSQSKTQGEAVE